MWDSITKLLDLRSVFSTSSAVFRSNLHLRVQVKRTPAGGGAIATELRPFVKEMVTEAATMGGMQPTIIYTHRKNKGGVKDIHAKLCELLGSHNRSLVNKVLRLPPNSNCAAALDRLHSF